MSEETLVSRAQLIDLLKENRDLTPDILFGSEYMDGWFKDRLAVQEMLDADRAAEAEKKTDKYLDPAKNPLIKTS